MTNRPVEIDIGELVLHGFPEAQRQPIAAAVRAELTRLIAREGLPAGTVRDVPQLRAPVVHVASGDSPRVMGQRIARAVHGALSR